MQAGPIRGCAERWILHPDGFRILHLDVEGRRRGLREVGTLGPLAPLFLMAFMPSRSRAILRSPWWYFSPGIQYS